jgi:signal peptidase I
MLIDDQSFNFFKLVIKKYGWLDLPASGNSMFPFIRQGNLCRFIQCDPSRIKKGDIILYYSKTGQLIAHRLVKAHQSTFLLKGDTNLGFDEPIEAEHMIGKLLYVQKQRKQITQNQLIARIWGIIILAFPVLSGLLRKHLNKKAKLQY